MDTKKPQVGLIQMIMDKVKPGTASANSTAGKVANRKDYNDYVIRRQEQGKEARRYDEWAKAPDADED